MTTSTKIPPIFSDGSSPKELFFMTPIRNLTSIFEKGIFSHKRANKIEHKDVSNQGVQGRRARKMVTNPIRAKGQKKALVVHRYANLYINAHNAMMYNIVFAQKKLGTLCVLRIRPEVLSRSEVVISTKNASTNGVKFISPHKQSRLSDDSTRILKNRSSNGNQEYRQIRQAEVLIPYQLNPSYIGGIYVPNKNVKSKVMEIFKNKCPVPINIHPSLFFQDSKFNSRLVSVTPSKLSNSAFPKLVIQSPESSSDESDSEDETSKSIREALGDFEFSSDE